MDKHCLSQSKFGGFWTSQSVPKEIWRHSGQPCKYHICQANSYLGVVDESICSTCYCLSTISRLILNKTISLYRRRLRGRLGSFFFCYLLCTSGILSFLSRKDRIPYSIFPSFHPHPPSIAPLTSLYVGNARTNDIPYVYYRTRDGTYESRRETTCERKR